LSLSFITPCFVEPTTGIEPVNPILTKDVLYLLSYVGTEDFTAPKNDGKQEPNAVNTPCLHDQRQKQGPFKSGPAVKGIPRSPKCGAGNGIRTRDPQLGRLTL
jgi:hypothetical protein